LVCFPLNFSGASLALGSGRSNTLLVVADILNISSDSGRVFLTSGVVGKGTNVGSGSIVNKFSAAGIFIWTVGSGVKRSVGVLGSLSGCTVSKGLFMKNILRVLGLI
jgi:hypothetical protein